MSQVYDDIMSEKSNYKRVKKFIDLGLDPRYGLSSEITILMFQLYQESSGDNSYAGRYGCSACHDQVFRRLKDFLQYDDNMGRELKNWVKK